MSDVLSKELTAPSFDGGDIPAKDVQLVMQAALRALQKGNSVHLYITDERGLLERLADARSEGAGCLRTASLAVVLAADRLYDGAWVENSSRVAWAMCRQAADLGVAYRQIQIRGYQLSDGTMSDEVVKGVLGISEEHTVCVVVALGYSGKGSVASIGDELDWERIHIIE